VAHFINTVLNIRVAKIWVKVKVKIKVKFTLEQATKSQRGSRGIAVLSL
jgi:hypothetical protein